MNVLLRTQAPRAFSLAKAAQANSRVSSALFHTTTSRWAQEDGKTIYGKDLTPSSPQLKKFSDRISVKLDDSELLLQSMTHKSFDHARVPTNERLEFVGEKVLNMYAAQHIFEKFADIDAQQYEDLLEQYIGKDALAQFGLDNGIEEVMRWKPASNQKDSKIGLNTVSAKAVSALVGAVFHAQGAKNAKEIIQKHLLAKNVELSQ
ncbi:ribonuclease III [Basidiobolus meristosporus CBS 931.73]|uniref:Ribonuclease III n=1 Tax=Basidiobolus meristosporus CBS 931.73 TaxID=1314790 RepID=A0A1Y1XUP6_9FUNG|nr:ribonuclease III [Basidiobolus meristosporus CBS 931.73]|eukprot:ORX89481.1 ribonuclease III [Basidiobolus meristosporus CBS 931.73]